jgi:hypothetical protein
MPKENTRGALPASILSLLVAADQCCPAIIGQAHLLYHAGLGINPEQAVRTFRQLKKDADDLFKAIADVEAALNQAETIQRGAERDDTERTNGPVGVRSLPARSSGPCSRGRT